MQVMRYQRRTVWNGGDDVSERNIDDRAGSLTSDVKEH